MMQNQELLCVGLPSTDSLCQHSCPFHGHQSSKAYSDEIAQRTKECTIQSESLCSENALDPRTLRPQTLQTEASAHTAATKVWSTSGAEKSQLNCSPISVSTQHTTQVIGLI